jgi:GDPmannose 4,6-dehydratase
MKKALITGITGQDGSYLAENLLDKGYEVHGIRRRSSVPNTLNLKHLQIDPHINRKRFFLHYGDLTDSSNLTQIISSTKPDEIYNLAAQSHVHTSFQVPEYTAEVNALGTIRLLDAVKSLNPEIKVYQASTSELYGNVLETPQNETTPFNPISPYSISKLYSFYILKNYRESYQIFGANGILFNHESPRRGTSFVTRKISNAVAKRYYKCGGKLYLGNLDAKRDWGYAKDYVEAMWLILQQTEANDLVIATGVNYSVREFVSKAFSVIDIEIIWEGSGLEEKGIDRNTGDVVVEIDPYYFRPMEVYELLGDASKAEKLLGWKPRTTFDELVEIMVEADIDANKIK